MPSLNYDAFPVQVTERQSSNGLKTTNLTDNGREQLYE